MGENRKRSRTRAERMGARRRDLGEQSWWRAPGRGEGLGWRSAVEWESGAAGQEEPEKYRGEELGGRDQGEGCWVRGSGDGGGGRAAEGWGGRRGAGLGEPSFKTSFNEGRSRAT